MDEKNVNYTTEQKAIVHGDMLLHNMLSENEVITGVLGWEPVKTKHRANDNRTMAIY
jgi:aminoglycoside phosphotransferase (APT) family kinase protein